MNLEKEFSPSSTNNLAIEDRALDCPPFFLSLLLGIQALCAHLLTLLYEPLILLSAVCLLPDDPNRGKIISLTLLFSSATSIIQCTIGTKSPILATPSRVYIALILIILNDERWKCPSDGDLYAMGTILREQKFNVRLCEIRGMFIIITVFQLFVCFSGLTEFTAKFVSPSTLATVLISSSLANLKRSTSQMNGSLCFLTMAFLLLFLVFQNVTIPVPRIKRGEQCSVSPVKVFKMLPMFAVIFSYLVYTFGFQKNEEVDEYLLRSVESTDWFPLSVFGLFGPPKFSLRTFLYSVGAALIQSFMSTIYFFIFDNFSGGEAKGSRARRGLSVELVCGVLCSIVGVPASVCSNPNMIGLMEITKVRTNKIPLIASVLLLILALSMKPLLLLVLMPVQCFHTFNTIIQGIIMSTGFSMLKVSRKGDCLVTSLSVVIGLIVPEWLLLQEKFLPIYIESSIWVSTATSFLLNLILPED